MSFILDRINARHADILKNPKMRQVLLPEGHPKPDALQTRDVFDQRLEFFMIQQVRSARTDLGIINVPADAHRLDLNPSAVFPVFALLSNLADVDLWVEVGGEWMAVIAGVAVHNINRINPVIVMLDTAQNTLVTPGSNPLPNRAMIPVWA